MQKEVCVVPVQCRKCGELFDLSYDLEGASEERMMSELLRAVARNPRALLCWECRALSR